MLTNQTQQPQITNLYKDDFKTSDVELRDFLNETSNRVMDYVWGLNDQIKQLGGTPPEWPFNSEQIARGMIGHFLNGKRIQLNFCDRNSSFNLVDPTAMQLKDSQFAEIIACRERTNKKFLPDILQAVIKRLTGV